MRVIITSIIATLCIGSLALAQYPVVNATVTISADSVSYSYRLTNNTSDDIWQFAVFMPMGSAATITAHTTSQDGWYTMIREAAFDMIGWDWDGSGVIAPGASADFSFETSAGVPTTSTYSMPGYNDTNWSWAYGVPGGGTVGVGNTSLPVPIPEPSSLLALAGGLGAVGLLLRKRVNSKQ